MLRQGSYSTFEDLKRGPCFFIVSPNRPVSLAAVPPRELHCYCRCFMTGNLASAAIWAISGMDALRIKCNKAEKEVEREEGGKRENKERQQARLDSPPLDKRFGGRVSLWTHTHKHKHWFPRHSARQGRGKPVCFHRSFQTRPSVCELMYEHMLAFSLGVMCSISFSESIHLSHSVCVCVCLCVSVCVKHLVLHAS